MARAEYRALIAALVRDDAGVVSEAQAADALDLAVLRYAVDRGVAGVLLTDAEDTIPPADREAVCALAAALLLDQLAARHAGDTDSTIQADAADRQALSDRYGRLAARWRKRYCELMGPGAAGGKRPRPAGAVAAPPRRRLRGAAQ